MKITINHNGFHGRTSRTIEVAGNAGDRVRLSESQAKKLSRAGCGSLDCKCGESMLGALMKQVDEYWTPGRPAIIILPAEGEINLRGNYPQS